MKRRQWWAALLALVLMLTMSVPGLAADTPSEEVAAPSEVSHVPLEDAAQTGVYCCHGLRGSGQYFLGSMGRGGDYHIRQLPRTAGSGTGF